MARVCMGGTFDVLHRGHEALLTTAFATGDEEVAIGLTTDAFANARRTRTVRPYAERAAAVESYIRRHGWMSRATIEPIDTEYGFALDARFTHIAATEETVGTAQAINAARAEKGLQPLAVVLAPYILADDARPIKATRIRAGELDADGRLKRPLRIAVGSANPVKVEATRRALAKMYGTAEVRGFAVDPGVPLQPFEDETWSGARTRAGAALEAWPEADFGVGIEAGLFETPAAGGPLDVQACVVLDRVHRATFGHGPGFAYPAHVAKELRAGKTVGEVMGTLSGISDIGKKTGAVGWLSRGHVTRTALTEPAVIMAFLPRLRPELYDL